MIGRQLCQSFFKEVYAKLDSKVLFFEIIDVLY